ncbi:MAG: hypothetical protein GWO19_22590, partial [Nitrospinaceae bacterium]|nr:hypothetical protein [Nitrospinaceae bacterium]
LLDKKLPPGAYIIEATGNGQTTRDLILVTDAALVLKASGTQALVYFCDVQNGAPLPQAQVSLWERYNNGRKWVWKVHSA